MAQAKLQVDWNRNRGSVTQSTLDVVIPTLFVTATTNGGWLSNLLRLPPDLDVKKPIDIVQTIAPVANSLVDGQFVVLNLIWAKINSAGIRTNATFNMTWPVPAGWITTDTQHVLLDSGSGHTFPANTFAPQDYLAVSPNRLGAAGGDTFAQSLHLCLGAELRYTSRYPWLVVSPAI